MGPFKFIGAVLSAAAGSTVKVLGAVDQYAGLLENSGKIANGLLEVEGEIILAEADSRLDVYRLERAKHIKALEQAEV